MKAKPFNLKEHHTAQEHHANITGVLGKFLFEKKGTLRVGYVYIYIIYTRYISLKCHLLAVFIFSTVKIDVSPFPVETQRRMMVSTERNYPSPNLV